MVRLELTMCHVTFLRKLGNGKCDKFEICCKKEMTDNPQSISLSFPDTLRNSCAVKWDFYRNHTGNESEIVMNFRSNIQYED